ncbi:MAG: hypothetical protein Q8K72_04470, partial [Acidimicrobiales bacterium]|nr:hypothetical protein [Acidimicrobiales bacterium]
MAELLRNLRAMCAVSWQADKARSIGSLLSTAFLPVSRSLQAVGLGLLADGVVRGEDRRALMGAIVVAMLVAANG